MADGVEPIEALTNDLDVCVVGAVEPVSAQPVVLDASGNQHGRCWEDHAHRDPRPQRRTATGAVQPWVNEAVEDR